MKIHLSWNMEWNVSGGHFRYHQCTFSQYSTQQINIEKKVDTLLNEANSKEGVVAYLPLYLQCSIPKYQGIGTIEGPVEQVILKYITSSCMQKITTS